jgi:transposase
MHLATDEHAMPLGATVTQAAANDGQQTAELLKALVIQPPPPDPAVANPDPRDLPTARADGAYGNGPTRRRTNQAGFRMEAPSRGQAKQAGVGQVRNAVERGHSFFAQFGRVARRFDRCARRYLGWIELAACIIFIRAGLVL